MSVVHAGFYTVSNNVVVLNRFWFLTPPPPPWPSTDQKTHVPVSTEPLAVSDSYRSWATNNDYIWNIL